MFKFDGEKQLKAARQRDYLRSKLPAGKRWRADDQAKEITQTTLTDQDSGQRQLDRQAAANAYDQAMAEAYKEVHKDKTIKSLVL